MLFICCNYNFFFTIFKLDVVYQNYVDTASAALRKMTVVTQVAFSPNPSGQKIKTCG